MLIIIILIQVIVAIYGHIKRNRDGNPEKEKKKTFIKTFVLNLVLIIIFFGAWEVLVKRYYDSTGKKPVFIHYTREWLISPNLRNYRHHVGGVDTILNTNSQGLREEEIPPEKEEGEIRILCLGDSWTIGQSVTDEETFVKQLGKMLKERYPKKNIRVINGGMFGYSVLQGYYIFKELNPIYKPDIVISCGFNYLANRDIKKYEDIIKHLGAFGTVKEFLSNFTVYQCLKKTVSRFMKEKESKKKGLIDPATSKEIFDKYSYLLYRECEKNGIEMIVFDHITWRMPEETKLIRTPEGHQYCTLPYDPSFSGVQLKLKEKNHRKYKDVTFHCIKPNKNFNRDNFYLKEDRTHHPTAEAHRAIAETLFRIIETRELIRD